MTILLRPTEWSTGPPRIYVPIVTADPQKQQGPLGYVLVERLTDCPRFVELSPPPILSTAQ